MKYLKLFEQFVNEKKPAGSPDWHDSDAPDANGRFKDLSIKDLAAWLIKTRNKDVKKISGSLTQQIVFKRVILSMLKRWRKPEKKYTNN